MKTYRVPAGINVIIRDLNKTMCYSPWKPEKDVLFIDSEFRGIDIEVKPTYQFVRGHVEFNVPVTDVSILNG